MNPSFDVAKCGLLCAYRRKRRADWAADRCGPGELPQREEAALREKGTDVDDNQRRRQQGLERPAGWFLSPRFAPPMSRTGLLRAFVATVSRLTRALSVFTGILFFIILLLVGAQIVCRVLGVSVPWTEEVSRLLFVWVIYLGAAVAFHDRAMIAIDTLPELAPRTSRWLPPVVEAIVFAILVFLFAASLPMVSSAWNTSLATVSWLSNGWAYVAFSVAFAIMLVHALAHLAGWLLARGVVR